MKQLTLKLAAHVAVFLCLAFISGCTVFENPKSKPFSAKPGTYDVKIVVSKDSLVKKHGYVAYYYADPPTIVLSDSNTLECAAHEIGHRLGWVHDEPSYEYCHDWRNQ